MRHGRKLQLHQVMTVRYLPRVSMSIGATDGDRRERVKLAVQPEAVLVVLVLLDDLVVGEVETNQLVVWRGAQAGDPVVRGDIRIVALVVVDDQLRFGEREGDDLGAQG